MMAMLKATESSSNDGRREIGLSSIPASSTPPPPGFPQVLTSSPVGNKHRDLESLRNGTSSSEGRLKPAYSAIWKDSRSIESNFYTSGNGIVNTRTTSFTDLAAMVGTGLAESMEDSTRDKQNRARLGADGCTT